MHILFIEEMKSCCDDMMIEYKRINDASSQQKQENMTAQTYSRQLDQYF